MSSIHRDQAIIAKLLEEINIDLTKATYDDEGRLLYLDISGLGLLQLPSEIWQLTNLQGLYLTNNQLSQLPAEIRQLTNLESLYLDNNQLTQQPTEILQLTNLQLLNLHHNMINQLPANNRQFTT